MALTLGVAIPCYVAHFKYLERLLQTIASSTVKPDRISISCSSWTDSSGVLFDVGGIPVELWYTTKVLNAAQNRNRAAATLTTDLISFIDADDLMHPKRLELVREVFLRESDIDAVYHNYSYDHQSKRFDPFWEEDVGVVHPGTLVQDPNALGLMITGDPTAAIHHAHVTVRQSVVRQVQFPEQREYSRLEDSMYGALLVSQKMRTAYLTNKLSRYIFGT